MNRRDIVELAKKHEGNADALKKVLAKAIESGEITPDDVDDAIGAFSDAYKDGFPGLYDKNPDWWAVYSTEKLREQGFPAFSC